MLGSGILQAGSGYAVLRLAAGHPIPLPSVCGACVGAAEGYYRVCVSTWSISGSA